jgi:hypothetical protein
MVSPIKRTLLDWTVKNVTSERGSCQFSIVEKILKSTALFYDDLYAVVKGEMVELY